MVHFKEFLFSSACMSSFSVRTVKKQNSYQLTNCLWLIFLECKTPGTCAGMYMCVQMSVQCALYVGEEWVS